MGWKEKMVLEDPGPDLEKEDKGWVQQYVDSAITLFSLFNVLAPNPWHMNSPETLVPRLPLMHQKIGAEYGVLGHTGLPQQKERTSTKQGPWGGEFSSHAGEGRRSIAEIIHL